MTIGDGRHRAAVDGWLERIGPTGPVPSLVQAFESTFAALWRRARVTLGEVTLTAIVRRVLQTAKRHFPLLTGLELEPSGLRCALTAQSDASPAEISAAIRFVLVEILVVIGNLTAQILTPALHAELARCPAAVRP